MDLYYSYYPATGWSRKGYDFGRNAAATAAQRNLPPGRVGIIINNLGKAYLKQPDNTGPGSADTIPALYAHTNDLITYVGRDRNNVVGILTKRTPWLTNGIAETRAWTDNFVRGYAHGQRLNDAVPNPDRFFFDQEVDDLCSDALPRCYIFSMERQKLGEVVDYWNAIKADPRWDTALVYPLPDQPGDGTRSRTLRDVWIAAGSPEPRELIPGEQPQWTYVGVLPQNHAWCQWWFSVMEQAYAGAMNDAIYSRVVAAFPNCKCGDFNNSLRMNGNYRYVRGDYYGSAGLHPQWNGLGQIQMSDLYPNCTMYHFASYAGPYPGGFPNGTPVTSQTKDFAPIPWAPYREPESEAFLRVKRSVLDSSYLSNNGANRWSLIPWTTLPNQSFPLYGNNQFDTPTTDPLGIYATMGYAQGVNYRTTKDDVRRGLSIARSRGVRELVIWNDWNFTYECGPPFFMLPCVGVHSHYAANWNAFRSALNQAWKPSLTSAIVSVGSPSGSAPLAPLQGALDDRLTVSSPVNSAVWVSFQFRVTEVPASKWRFEIECASDLASSIKAIAYDTTTPAAPWKTIDLDPTSTGQTRNSPAGGATVRASGEFSGAGFNAAGIVNVTVIIEPSVRPAPVNTVWIDQVRLMASDNDTPNPADFNTDGFVNVQDMNDYNLLWRERYINNRLYYADKKISPYVDFDKDGVVTDWDWVQFNTAWTNDPTRQ